jgi:CHAD domain-containing protein
MAYRFELDRPASRQLVRIVREQIEHALHSTGDSQLPLGERVHASRTACKRIRAALRLARSAQPNRWREENAFFRDAARELAPLREAAVMPLTLSALLKQGGEAKARDFAAIRRRILAHRREALSGQAMNDAGIFTSFRARMHEASRRWARLKLRVEVEDFVNGFVDTYRWARRAWSEMRPDSPAARWHEWRKRTKIHAYHCRLLRNVWPEIMHPWQRELNALCDQLGDEHDLAVLGQWIERRMDDAGDRKSIAALRGLMAARRKHLRRESLFLGRRLFADKPRATARRVAIWWKAAEAWHGARETGRGRATA